ncbi:T9SS type A sorting domain-containing protein [Psychroserpens sp. MEBiC05023]
MVITIISFVFGLNAQIQIGNDIDGLLAGHNFGTGVSISADGDIVAIVGFSGIPGDGRIRVFENTEDEWVLYGTDNNNQNFGGVGAFSVSLSADGNTIAFSSLGESVKIYSYDASIGVWSPKGNAITNSATISHFGYSLKLSADGNILAIGSPASPIVPEAGITQIFQFASNSWNQVGNDIVGLNATEHSGRSIDLSSDGNIISILNDNAVRVYQNVSDTWTILGNEIPAQGSQFPNKAVSLSSNGNILAIGEPDFTDGLIQRGRVRVFSYNDSAWSQIGSDITGEVAYYRTGSSVSLSSNGELLAIGEIGSSNDNGTADTGRIRLFKNQGQSWAQIGNDIFGEGNLDHSGSSISLSANANTIVIGAAYNDGNGTDSGHARIFNLSDLLSIDAYKHPKISVFPNPVKSQLNIGLPINIELKNAIIYNSLGAVVLSTKNNIIDTSKLSSGMYYIEINTIKTKIIKKLVIQ